MGVLKKNLSIILVILVTVLLITMVIWMFDKKMKTIEKKVNSTTGYFNASKFDSLKKNILTHFKLINQAL